MKKKKPSTDINVTALEILQAVTGQEQDEPVKKKKLAEEEKNPAAVALGRLGGIKGGKARAQSLSPEKRKSIARKAAKARWGKS